MKKVLFYCQHLLGIGHVTRSLSIVNELSGSFEVTYVQGGPPVPLEPVSAVRKVQLQPLLMREHDSSLYDPGEKLSVEEIFSRRREQLSALAAEGFDYVVIELYPFGRKKFGKEVLAFLAEARAKNPKLRVICSVRDILVEKEDGGSRNRKIAEVVNRHFDRVWVHSDEELVRFGDTFSAEPEIRDRIDYTGFVAEPPKAAGANREKRILCSLGGGSVGEELYRAVAGVVPCFPDYTFQFVFGPYTSASLRKDMERVLGDQLGRVEFSGLLKNFEEVLARSALSLSMAGYNTVMNLLNTRTPALVLTYDANHEQLTRAELLEKKGYLGVLRPDSLRAETLSALMSARLLSAYPATVPNLSGSRRARELLEALQ